MGVVATRASQSDSRRLLLMLTIEMIRTHRPCVVTTCLEKTTCEPGNSSVVMKRIGSNPPLFDEALVERNSRSKFGVAAPWAIVHDLLIYRRHLSLGGWPLAFVVCPDSHRPQYARLKSTLILEGRPLLSHAPPRPSPVERHLQPATACNRPAETTTTFLPSRSNLLRLEIN